MTGELFPAKSVRQLSPRLKWCKQHHVVTERNPKRAQDELWTALSTTMKWQRIGRGPTEEEACRDFGVKSNIALWNEVAP